MASSESQFMRKDAPMAHFTTKTLRGQLRPINWPGCHRASLRSR